MTTNELNAKLNEIAKEILGIETLETQNADHLDFHDLAAWTLKDALLAAFSAGQASTTKRS